MREALLLVLKFLQTSKSKEFFTETSQEPVDGAGEAAVVDNPHRPQGAAGIAITDRCLA